MHRHLLISLLVASIITPVMAFDSGSTGADGAFLPSVDTDVQLPEDGILNYTQVIIPENVTVRFLPNSNNTPVTLLVSGDAVIAGSIDISGENGAPAHGAGNGAVADDGLPGSGGPGGYRGGAGGPSDPNDASLFGARIAESGIGPGAGPAGGVIFSGSSLRCNGYGAAFATNGADGCTSNGGDGIDPAQSYGNTALLPLIGGSGGSGGPGGSARVGTGGGGGAGAMLIAVSGTLTLNGEILANGGTGGDSLLPPNTALDYGHGGGGSGGAVRLAATTLEGNGPIFARGGRGGVVFIGNSNSTVGGAGSSGRIRLEAETSTYSGTTNPLATSSVPNSVFLTGTPVLRIASVAGIPAPASPTGMADIVLPADEPNPVLIELEASNVPLGNTISVRVTPPSGATIVATSDALDGTEANSTATAMVDLSEGPSTMLATLRFNIAEDDLMAFTDYTNGEPVVAVELLATLDNQAQTVLITESGQRITMPSQPVSP